MTVLKKYDSEADFQRELCQVDEFDNIVFGELSRENVKNYYELKKQIKRLIRKYQTLVMRQGKVREIVAMQEFEKYQNLETQQIH